MSELKPLFDLFTTAGWAPPPIPEAAHLVAYGHQLASLKSLPGERVEAEASDSGIDARIVIAEGTHVDQPIHLCFGLFQ